MSKKTRNGLILGLVAVAFLTWVVLYNLYPPEPQLPWWFELPEGSEVVALRSQPGTSGPAGPDTYARIVIPGRCRDVVNALKEMCDSNHHRIAILATQPASRPATRPTTRPAPAPFTTDERQVHASRLQWLRDDYLPLPDAPGIFLAAQHTGAPQAGIFLFAWPQNKTGANDPNRTVRDLLVTGSY